MSYEGGITIEQAIDLGVTTLKNLKKDQWEETLKHNEYLILDKLYKGKDVETVTGKSICRQITLGNTGNASHTKMFKPTQTNVKNIQKEINVPFCMFHTSFSYEVREVLAQGGIEGLVDLLKLRRNNMYVEAADEIEEKFWTTPVNSDDTENPMGIFAWLTKGTDGQVGWYGVNGAYSGTGAFNPGGIDAAKYDRWKSYFGDYGTTLDDTTLSLMSQAFRKTKFKSPATAEGIGSKDSNFALYTNDAVIQAFEKLATQSDDNVGADLGKYAGAVIYKRLPLRYVDILDTANTTVYGTNPIVGVNWNYIVPVILKGDRFRESKPMNSTELPNVLTVHCDLSYNYICTNRRHAGFLLSNV